jgi:hypothetical protein
VEKYGKTEQAIDDNIIRRMRFARSITNATDILRVRNTYCFSTPTVVTKTHLNVTLYVHRMSCVLLRSLRVVPALLLCPVLFYVSRPIIHGVFFYLVPEHGSFITHTACIRRDITLHAVLSTAIKRTLFMGFKPKHT